MALPTVKLTQNTFTPPVEEYSDPQVNASPVAPAQALALTLQVPVVTIEYNNPGEFPATLMLYPPTPTNSVIPVTETLVLSLEVPTIMQDESPTAPAQALALAIPVPSLTIDSQVFVGPPFNITATGPNGLSPTLGYLTVTPQRTIKDPIVGGGCPQCGTFLYPKKGSNMPTDSVSIGRNFENVKDDIFVRCGRCGWLVKRTRHPSMPERSRAGWGINYTDIVAGESDISYP